MLLSAEGWCLGSGCCVYRPIVSRRLYFILEIPKLGSVRSLSLQLTPLCIRQVLVFSPAPARRRQRSRRSFSRWQPHTEGLGCCADRPQSAGGATSSSPSLKLQEPPGFPFNVSSRARGRTSPPLWHAV
ncbi:hypothetical protein GN956_G20747 [Arapaima gigas]